MNLINEVDYFGRFTVESVVLFSHSVSGFLSSTVSAAQAVETLHWKLTASTHEVYSSDIIDIQIHSTHGV